MAPSVQIQCTGKLYEARPVGPPSNLTIAYNQIGTYLVLIGLLYYAWHLRSNAVPVSDVSYSYDKVVTQGQYWRCITASVSHFDVWHLGFNCFCVISNGYCRTDNRHIEVPVSQLDLVLLTMAVCTGMYHLMIFQADRPEQATAEAVGYSCVLFAWIVTVAVRLGQFCPLFFSAKLLLPRNICGSVHQHALQPWPIGAASDHQIHHSSLFLCRPLGGIIIGLPLVWGWLDWLTPIVLVSILLALVLYNRNLDVRKYAGYSYGTQYQELPQASSHHMSSAGVDNGVNDSVEDGERKGLSRGLLVERGGG